MAGNTIDATSAFDTLKQVQGQQIGIYSTTQDLVNATMDLGKRQDELQQEQLAENTKNAQKAAKAGQDIATALGANPNEPNYRLEKLSAMKAQATDAALADLDRASKLEATSFFDNPLGWVGNQLEAGDVKAKADINIKKATIINEEMRTINEQITNGMATQQLINKSISDADMARELELASITSKMASNKMQLEAISTKADALKGIADNSKAMISANQQAAELAFRRQEHIENRADAKAYRDQQQSNWEMTFAANKEQKDIANARAQHKLDFADGKYNDKHDIMVANANSYRQANAALNMGLTLSDDPKQVQAQIALMKSQDKNSVAYKQYQLLTNATLYQESFGNSQGIPLGYTPIEAISNSGLVDSSKLSQGQRVILDILNQAKSNIESEVTPGTAKATVDAAINSTANQTWALMLKSPQNYEATRLADLEQLGSLSGVNTTKLWKNYIFEKHTEGKIKLSDDEMLDLATKAIEDGKLSAREAATELSTIYSLSLAQKRVLYPAGLMGLTPQTSYRYNARDVSADTTRALDLSNPTDMATALTLRAINSSWIKTISAKAGITGWIESEFATDLKQQKQAEIPSDFKGKRPAPKPEAKPEPETKEVK